MSNLSNVILNVCSLGQNRVSLVSLGAGGITGRLTRRVGAVDPLHSSLQTAASASSPPAEAFSLSLLINIKREHGGEPQVWNLRWHQNSVFCWDISHTEPRTTWDTSEVNIWVCERETVRSWSNVSLSDELHEARDIWIQESESMMFRIFHLSSSSSGNICEDGDCEVRRVPTWVCHMSVTWQVRR